ncbi:MAG: ATP-binding cassette domain-containing protein, partial [Acidobacteriota bacterium]
MLCRLFGRKRGNGKTADEGYKHGNEHLIELQKVVKSFNTAAGTFTALKGVDLRVNAGEFVAVIGKSGSGKSTLINMITGIDRPTSGAVYLGDTAVHKLDEGQMAVWRGRQLGIVFQFFQLLPTLTIVENVMLPMDFCNTFPARERSKRAMHLLDLVDMTEHARKLPSAVSGGQQQRVAIARALANDPPILIADEPTGNLDSKTADSVFELFEDLVGKGKTILMVTHDNDLAKRVTRSVLISDGQIIEQYLAKAFPTLSEDKLVEITHKLNPDVYAPGTVILKEGTPADRFYLIMKGKVDVLIRQPNGTPMVVTSMERGQYFGEIELLTDRQNIATIRASLDTGVEVAALDREVFKELVGEAPEVRQQI